jgi:hypothetical protein
MLYVGRELHEAHTSCTVVSRVTKDPCAPVFAWFPELVVTRSMAGPVGVNSLFISSGFASTSFGESFAPEP